ncbi:hypothetical protein JCM18899A_38810 [Nocardioides sp. AN3]
MERWVKPEEFVELEAEATQIGFSGVMSGPLVRSSRAGRIEVRLASSSSSREEASVAPVLPAATMIWCSADAAHHGQILQRLGVMLLQLDLPCTCQPIPALLLGLLGGRG